MMTGLLAPQRFDSEIGGDESLGRRPMARVIEPLERMGARIESVGQRAPLRIRGGAALAGIDYRLPVASAQVKTAVLLSGLHAEGVTRVREPVPSRDHTERLLEAFGAISSRDREGQQVEGGGSLEPVSFRLPGDVSSAAFFIGAAAALPGSHLVVEGVGLNPTRTGCLDVLRAMGAPIEERVETVAAGEPVGTVTVIGAELQGTEVPRDWVPRLIDEIPILAVAAATAQGETRFHGVGELRHKESDRLARIIQGLNALGAEAEQQGDGLVIRGGAAFRPARLVSDGDHRMAMAWGMASLASGEPCQVTDRDWVRVSYPDFWQELDRLAA
jgi:3-phosphoshikimate 1-carboxyvinyltransferase